MHPLASIRVGFRQDRAPSISPPVRQLRPFRVLEAAWVWILFVLFFGLDAWGWGRIFDWLPIRIATDLLVVAVAGAWLWGKALRGDRLKVPPLALPLMGLMAASGVSGLYAQTPSAAAEPLIALALLVLWWHLVWEGANSHGWGRMLPALFLGASALLAAQPVLEFVSWYTGTPFASPTGISWLQTEAGFFPPAFPRSTPASGPIVVSGVLATLAPPAGVLLLSSRSFWARLAVSAWLALAAAALLLNAARAGWLAVAAGCGVTLVLLVLARREEASRLPVRWAAAVLGSLAALSLLVLAISLVARPTTLLQRLFIWGEGARVWLQQPVTGVGPGNYVLAQISARSNAILEDVHGNAHNLPIHILAVAGVLGVAAGVWLVGGFLAAALGRWCDSELAERRRGAGYLGAVVAWGAFGLADVQTVSFMLCLLGVAVAALALAPSAREVEAEGKAMTARPPSIGFRIILGAFPLVLAFAFFLVELDHLPAYRAEGLARQGRWDAASAVLKGASASPVGHFYSQQAGLAQVNGGRAHEAQQTFRDAVEGPASAPALATAAWTAAEMGDAERALALAGRAVQVQPREARYPLVLGALYDAAGRPADAADAYGHALALRPGWVTSNYWGAPDRRADKAEVVRAALAWLETDGEIPRAERAVLEADLLNRLGRYAEAQQVLTKALAGLGGRDGEPLAEEAVRLVRGEVRSLARREFALFDPAGALTGLYYQMGVVALGHGDHAAARDAFQTAVRSSAGFGQGYLGLSATALGAGDAEGAVRYGKLAVVYRGGREAAAALGRALLAAGRAGEAVAWLERGTLETRSYTMEFGLKVYGRREILPPVPPGLPDLAPDRELAAVEKDLERARAAAVGQ